MLYIPELEIKKIIDGCLLHLKNDYDEKVDKTKTLLYNMYNGQIFGKFNYYNEAVSLFTKDIDDPSKIETRLFFDLSRASIPTIHITLPNESKGEMDGIGVDLGYADVIENVDGFMEPNTRSFSTQYRIVFTSNNTFEVLLMYYTIRAFMIGIFESIELAGLRNLKLSGGDLNINPQLVPPGIFLRALNLNFNYEVSQSIFTKETAHRIILEANNSGQEVIIEIDESQS